MSRTFIFIDESGDAGRHTLNSSSQYYQLNIMILNRESLGKVSLQFSRLRYFLDSDKELDALLWNHKSKKKIEDIFSSISLMGGASMYIFYVDKSNYSGPYYQDLYYDPKKFRNFLIRKSIEYIYNNESDLVASSESIEIVIDRFIDNPIDEENLKLYLKGNIRFHNLLHVVQIDSEYSEHIQAVDMLGKIAKKSRENSQSFEIAPIIDMTQLGI